MDIEQYREQLRKVEEKCDSLNPEDPGWSANSALRDALEEVVRATEYVEADKKPPHKDLEFFKEVYKVTDIYGDGDYGIDDLKIDDNYTLRANYKGGRIFDKDFNTITRFESPYSDGSIEHPIEVEGSITSEQKEHIAGRIAEISREQRFKHPDLDFFKLMKETAEKYGHSDIEGIKDLKVDEFTLRSELDGGSILNGKDESIVKFRPVNPGNTLDDSIKVEGHISPEFKDYLSEGLDNISRENQVPREMTRQDAKDIVFYENVTETVKTHGTKSEKTGGYSLDFDGVITDMHLDSKGTLTIREDNKQTFEMQAPEIREGGKVLPLLLDDRMNTKDRESILNVTREAPFIGSDKDLYNDVFKTTQEHGENLDLFHKLDLGNNYSVTSTPYNINVSKDNELILYATANNQDGYNGKLQEPMFVNDRMSLKQKTELGTELNIAKCRSEREADAELYAEVKSVLKTHGKYNDSQEVVSLMLDKDTEAYMSPDSSMYITTKDKQLLSARITDDGRLVTKSDISPDERTNLKESIAQIQERPEKSPGVFARVMQSIKEYAGRDQKPTELMQESPPEPTTASMAEPKPLGKEDTALYNQIKSAVEAHGKVDGTGGMKTLQLSADVEATVYDGSHLSVDSGSKSLLYVQPVNDGSLMGTTGMNQVNRIALSELVNQVEKTPGMNQVPPQKVERPTQEQSLNTQSIFDSLSSKVDASTTSQDQPSNSSRNSDSFNPGIKKGGKTIGVGFQSFDNIHKSTMEKGTPVDGGYKQMNIEKGMVAKADAESLSVTKLDKQGNKVFTYKAKKTPNQKTPTKTMNTKSMKAKKPKDMGRDF